jgi:hypothetical protein
MHGFHKSPHRKPQGRPRGGLEGLPATLPADGPTPQKIEKIGEANQVVAKAKNGKNGLYEKPRSRALIWERVNSVTWRLADPNGSQVLVPRSIGQWAGFRTPSAVAWIFDVGDERIGVDWRIRVRQRRGWRAFGSVGDLELAKRIARTLINGE